MERDIKSDITIEKVDGNGKIKKQHNLEKKFLRLPKVFFCLFGKVNVLNGRWKHLW